MSDISRGWKCNQCNLNFANEKVLQKHKNEKHSQSVIKCIKCNLRFSNAETFRVHWNRKHFVAAKVHRDPAPSTSSHATMEFLVSDASDNDESDDSNADSLSSSKENQLAEVPKRKQQLPTSKRCHICYKVFASIPFAILHFKRVHMEWTQTCDVCQKKMKKNLYVSHIKKHLLRKDISEQAFDQLMSKCEEVRKIDRSSKVLSPKIQPVKSGAFSCPNCLKSFNVNRNMRIHYFHCKINKRSTVQLIKGFNENKKSGSSFPCTKCDESYVTQRALASHQKKHKNEFSPSLETTPTILPNLKSVTELRSKVPNVKVTSEKCPLCKKVFSSVPNAKQHFQNVHRRDRVVKCPKCLITFSHINNCRVHFAKQHPNDTLPIEMTSKCSKAGHLKENNEDKSNENNSKEEPAKINTAQSSPLLKMFQKIREKNATLPPKPKPTTSDVIEIADDKSESSDCQMLTLNFDRCVNCDKTFKCREAAQLHYYRNHPTEMQMCPECDMLIINSRSIPYHWKRNHTNLPIPFCIKSSGASGVSKQLFSYFKQNHCASCNETFDSAADGKEHFNKEHHTRFELCSACFRGFRNERLLMAHWWQKHYERPFAKYGEKEEIAVDSGDEVKVLDKIKSGKRIFYPFIDSDKCPICDRLFTNRTSCTSHYKLVHAKNGIECSLCDLKYARIAHLKEHWQLAHKNKPWNQEEEMFKLDVEMHSSDSNKEFEDVTLETAKMQPKGNSNLKLVVSLVDIKNDVQSLSPKIREQLIEISKEIVNTVKPRAEPLPENKEERVYVLLSGDDAKSSQDEPLDLSMNCNTVADMDVGDYESLPDLKPIRIEYETVSDMIDRVPGDHQNDMHRFDTADENMVLVENIEIKEEQISP